MNPTTLNRADAAQAGSKQPATEKAGVGTVAQFVVRIGRAAVFFHVNMHSKPVYSVVPDDEASKFDTAQQAFEQATLFKMHEGTFRIENLEETNHSVRADGATKETK